MCGTRHAVSVTPGRPGCDKTYERDISPVAWCETSASAALGFSLMLEAGSALGSSYGGYSV